MGGSWGREWMRQGLALLPPPAALLVGGDRRWEDRHGSVPRWLRFLWTSKEAIPGPLPHALSFCPLGFWTRFWLLLLFLLFFAAFVVVSSLLIDHLDSIFGNIFPSSSSSSLKILYQNHQLPHFSEAGCPNDVVSLLICHSCEAARGELVGFATRVVRTMLTSLF